MSDTNLITSALKVLDVLRLLEKHFATGLRKSQIATALNITPIAAHRCVSTLVEAGYVSEIHETGLWRPSVAYSRAAVQIMNGLDAMTHRADELKQNITTG